MKINVDEHGVRFVTFSRDPAHKYILALNKKGYQYIVLPRKTYVTGEVVQAESDDYIRNVRLRDCIKELHENI